MSSTTETMLSKLLLLLCDSEAALDVEELSKRSGFGMLVVRKRLPDLLGLGLIYVSGHKANRNQGVGGHRRAQLYSPTPIGRQVAQRLKEQRDIYR